jgi:coenzyme PQQ precursor peptide PqqA
VSLNVLICLCFDGTSHKSVKDHIALQHKMRGTQVKISLANFLFVARLSREGGFRPFARRAKMAWKTPKIVEVSVGMEINMYACAARK